MTHMLNDSCFLSQHLGSVVPFYADTFPVLIQQARYGLIISGRLASMLGRRRGEDLAMWEGPDSLLRKLAISNKQIHKYCYDVRR